jgi:transcriptional regulator with XRE-family HTH domain
MSYFGTELARLMAARGLGVRELARMVPCNPGHISNLRSGKAQPSPELAQALDERLGAGGTLRALAPARVHHGPEPAVAWDDGAADEIAALDLGRLAEASEVGTGTVERLELAVDELATAYPGTPPAELLGRVRAYLGYLGRLLVLRVTEDADEGGAGGADVGMFKAPQPGWLRGFGRRGAGGCGRGAGYVSVYSVTAERAACSSTMALPVA